VQQPVPDGPARLRDGPSETAVTMLAGGRLASGTARCMLAGGATVRVRNVCTRCTARSLTIGPFSRLTLWIAHSSCLLTAAPADAPARARTCALDLWFGGTVRHHGAFAAETQAAKARC